MTDYVPEDYRGYPPRSKDWYWYSGGLEGYEADWYSQESYSRIAQKIGEIHGRQEGYNQNPNSPYRDVVFDMPGCPCPSLDSRPVDLINYEQLDAAWYDRFGAAYAEGFSKGYSYGLNHTSGVIDPVYIEFDIISLLQGGFLLRKSIINVGNTTVKEFNLAAYADDIVKINRTTDGGGVLYNGTPSSAINSALYYETAAEQGASIFRSIAHGHMFFNGNKRTAIEAFKIYANHHGLKTVSQKQMLNVATEVAQGNITDVSQIAKMLTK